MNSKKIFALYFLILSVFVKSADHLVFSRIVVKPDNAELIIIYNPTSENIDLDNYYISDDKDYYKIHTEGDMSPSHPMTGFTARFPNIVIESNDSLILCLNDNYSSFYDNLIPDLTLFSNNSGIAEMLETESNSFGLASNKLDNFNESLILFKWQGSIDSKVEDIDYFLWGGYQNAVNKTSVDTYLPDTNPEEQLYFIEETEDNYAYSRILGFEEYGEQSSGGNGISTNDGTSDNETSENFRESWEVIPLFNLGCTDLNADNYDSDATVDDGSCEYSNTGAEYTINEIINNCDDSMGESLECDGQYDLSSSSSSNCPLYETQISTRGVIVDYFDITPFNGPHSFTIEDSDGRRVDFVIWPESSSFQGGFDITQTELSILTQPPFNTYEVEITGKLGAYCNDDQLLDIYSEWQITVEYENDIISNNISDNGSVYNEDGVCFNKIGILLEQYTDNSECLSNNYEWIKTNRARIFPLPYVIIPTLGEKLDYSYISPSKSRTIIRIFDISGRFITTLVDRYDDSSKAIVMNSEKSSWNGRDKLGQVVSPGTYLIHIEAINFKTGKTTIDLAPVIVGVK